MDSCLSTALDPTLFLCLFFWGGLFGPFVNMFSFLRLGVIQQSTLKGYGGKVSSFPFFFLRVFEGEGGFFLGKNCSGVTWAESLDVCYIGMSIIRVV